MNVIKDGYEKHHRIAFFEGKKERREEKKTDVLFLKFISLFYNMMKNGFTSRIFRPFYLTHHYAKILYNSELFANIAVALFNFGSKFIVVQYSRTTNIYLTR